MSISSECQQLGIPLTHQTPTCRFGAVADYPRTIQEFEERFSTEEGCRAYLVSLRWPDGFRCPHCQESKAVMVRGTLFRCCACRRQTSATAGTIFQDRRKPLVTWFRAMWYVTSQKNGASALGLQRVLGLGSYETAWTWLHKLRRAMVRPDRERLKGWVEVDETLVGGLEQGVAGRPTESKALVVIAAEADGPGIGRIRMRVIEDVKTPLPRACIPSFRIASSREVCSTPMVGKATRDWTRRGTSERSRCCGGGGRKPPR
jgi:hypothetical protein